MIRYDDFCCGFLWLVSFSRKHELRLETVTATQRYIEEFKKQQAEWRRLEREKMEEENRRILEYAKYQERKEEDRMASVRQREATKEKLHKLVGEPRLQNWNLHACQ